jgi:O-antigen ligase/tetratricopeptide (TPR) repeat protein
MRAARIEAACFTLAAGLAVGAVPLAMGGRHPVGQVILTVAAILAVVSWLLRAWAEGDAVWRVGPLDMLFLVGLLIGGFQIAPLPPSWIQALAPRLEPLLPCLDGSPGSLGRWDRLSLAPGETLACLGILLAQGVFVTILVQRIRSVRDVERMLDIVTWTCGLLAALGIVQYLAGNGRYLWVYDFVHTGAAGAVKGTFTNRNHYAGFLAIGCGAVIWRALAATAERKEWHPRLRVGGWLVLAAVGFAAISSLSRGGSLALAVAVIVSLVCLAGRRSGWLPAALGLSVAGSVAAVALSIHGWSRLESRFAHLFTGDPAAATAGRLEVWKAALQASAKFPWLGTGAGSHAEVAPLFMPPTGGIVFTHAENSYLTLAVEAGGIGLTVALTAFVCGLLAAVRLICRGDQRERLAATAIVAGLMAAAAHALVDFTWHVPACSTLLITLGACGLALAARRVSWIPLLDLRLGRPAAAVAAAGVITLLAGSGARQIMAARAEPFWEQAIREGRAMATATRPLNADPAAGDGVTDPLRARLDARIAALEACLAWRPDHPRARTELAVARLERFGLVRHADATKLGLIDLRLAAMRASFSSREDLLDWVRRTTGPDHVDLEAALRDALEAIRVTPLAGEAWCVVGQLAFLAGRPAAAAACVAQGLRVRPTNAVVLFEAAAQAALDGAADRAIELLRASFKADVRQRARIIALLVTQASSAEACELLEPDLDGLRSIDAAWSRRESAEQLATVRERRLEAALARSREVKPTAAAGLLQEAARLQQAFGHTADARATLEAAVRTDPTSYPAHRALAELLVTLGDVPAAQRELEWCLLRRPDSQDLRRSLANLRSLRAAANPSSSTGQPVTSEKFERL